MFKLSYDTIKTKYAPYIAYLLMLIPAFIYLGKVYTHAINLPSQDDYDAVLNLLSHFKHASFSDKIALLFSQHNEHRILFSRTVCVIHYYVFGNINFRHLILFNGIQLIGIFLFCIYFIKKSLPSGWQIAAIVLSLGLFDLNNFENADCALAGLFNYSMILLFLATIYFYNSANKYHILAAAFLQIVSVYSGGNGIISTFFVVLFTLFSQKKKNAILSIAIFLVTAPLYYYHYESATAVYFTKDVSVVSRIFFNSLGANFGIQIGFIAGLIFFILYLFVFPVNKKLQFNTPFLPLICLGFFMMTSMLVMSMFRGKLPVEAAYSSRYLVYTHILFAIFGVFLLAKVKDDRPRLIFLVFSTFIYFLNFSGGDAGFDGTLSTLRTTDYYYPVKDIAKQSADQACKEGVYCIEKHRLDRY